MLFTRLCSPVLVVRCALFATMFVVTLVYSAHDEEHNDALVLKEVLLEKTRKPQDG
jgi:hypothetical protein